MKKALLIGNLTIDHNLTESGSFTGPGGSVYFGAKTYLSLGLYPVIISSYGIDYDLKWLKGINIFPQHPHKDKTLVFRNIYHRDCRREQWVENFVSDNLLPVKQIPDYLLKAQDIVYFAPLLNNFDNKKIINLTKRFYKSLKVFLPQGLFRTVGKKGKISPFKWKNPEEVIKKFDIIIFSREDMDNAEKIAEKWSAYGPIVVVTKDKEGCSILNKGNKIDISAFKVDEIIDSTGAGDIFAAAFSFAYLKCKDLQSCGVFANATASISLRFNSNQVKYNYRDILYFIKRQNIKIEL